MRKTVFNSLLAAVLIPGGMFTPFYGLNKNQKSISIKSFRIDKYPVTNKEFLNFVQKYPSWQKENIAEPLADGDYLKHWQGKASFEKLWNVPVTYVSWYAAQDYCKTQGGRLPTVFEWEYVGAASSTKKDASHDPEFIKQLLKWYSKPTDEGKIPSIGHHKPNIFGVYDLHGGVWEWTYDFNGVFLTGDNRQEKDKLKNLFCGAAGEGAQNRVNYAAFMRYALRNSLKAHYTLMNLGFRCAYDVP